MKPFRIFSALAICGSLGYALAQAASPGDDQIAARQTEMKANGKAIGALVLILKGETPYDSALVKSQVDAIAAATLAAAAAGAWDTSSQSGTLKTRAKPDIWVDTAGFSAAQASLETALAGLAASTDEASFKAAFPALGASCKGCHEKFRSAEQ